MLLRVVVAIEPRSYRQVIGRALRALRPHLVEVVVLDPDTLEAGVARMEPHLVFADRPNAFAPQGGPVGSPVRVELRPYEMPPPARVCLAGRRWELEEVDLPDLLAIVDQTEELSRATSDLGNC
jgi:hypothetical protein